MRNTPTLEAIREKLSRLGKTHTDIACELDVGISTVQGVLSGRLQGRHGNAHKVAVALGLKDGVIVSDMPIADALKTLVV